MGTEGTDTNRGTVSVDEFVVFLRARNSDPPVAAEPEAFFAPRPSTSFPAPAPASTSLRYPRSIDPTSTTSAGGFAGDDRADTSADAADAAVGVFSPRQPCSHPHPPGAGSAAASCSRAAVAAASRVAAVAAAAVASRFAASGEPSLLTSFAVSSPELPPPPCAAASASASVVDASRSSFAATSRSPSRVFSSPPAVSSPSPRFARALAVSSASFSTSDAMSSGSSESARARRSRSAREMDEIVRRNGCGPASRPSSEFTPELPRDVDATPLRRRAISPSKLLMSSSESSSSVAPSSKMLTSALCAPPSSSDAASRATSTSSAVSVVSTKNASPFRPKRIVKSVRTPFTVTVTTFSGPRMRPWYFPNRT
ncbi:uncharacterized protein MICPUCDRAFT_47175 [Micromonas pusilla CCMP1545]|uniref:Predicted protein n=1 Tax=Micromonas pusilla (strain CCMP1545) TaxID=564608 RepID=C1MRH3_MICPC|nr:uncharacterized protein MICPUCDRAFT_47175 [Micromonas pusilla CCMP1545]EEH57877.1 predicted protein [Micromonas pusilla CCMP1545]|eukprot:XP_003057926.1 predicted protein [Micromonas pusilla CCMP1545]